MTDRAGFTLIETLVALVIVATTATTAAGLTAATSRALTAADRRETELAAADRLLTAYSLLTARDLELRLGGRPAGEFVVQVDRPRPTLYRVAIRRGSSAAGRDLLATVLYRPQDGLR